MIGKSKKKRPILNILKIRPLLQNFQRVSRKRFKTSALLTFMLFIISGIYAQGDIKQVGNVLVNYTACYPLFKYMGSNSLEIRDGAAIDAVNNFSFVQFDYGQPDGTMLSVDDNSLEDEKLVIPSVAFLNNPGSRLTNVTKSYSKDTLLFIESSGFFTGELHENDPFDVNEGNNAITTKTWTGNVNTLWSTDGNWNPAGEPADSENVVIDGSASRNPEIFNSAKCNDIIIKNNGFLLINIGRSLDVNGNMFIGQTDDKDDGILTLYGAATLRIAGDYIKKDQSVLNSGSSTVIFDGSGNQQIYSGGVDKEDDFNHILVSKRSGTASLADHIMINGNYIVTSGIVDAAGFDMAVSGSWMNIGTFYPQSGTVTLNASTAGIWNIIVGNSSFNHLMINSTDTYQLSADMEVNGDLTISSGVLNANGFDIKIGGNWANNGTFNAGTGLLTFNGSGDQEINSGGTGVGKSFTDVLVSKPAGSVMLLSDLDIDGNLTVSSGVFNVNSHTLQFGDQASDLLSVFGVFKVRGLSRLQMTDGSRIDVNNGGILEVVGSNVNKRATISHLDSGHYSIDILSGGSIDAKFAVFEFTGGNGLHIHSGSDVSKSTKLDHTRYQEGTGNAYLTISNSQDIAITGAQFDSATTARTTYNVANNSTGSLEFNNYRGNIAGVNYEADGGSGTRGYTRWYFTQTELVKDNSVIFGNDVVITTTGDLGNVTVSLLDNALSIAPFSVARRYTIQPEKSGPASLRLYYGTQELQTEVEDNLSIWQRRGGNWTNLGGIVNPGQNYVEVAGSYDFIAGIVDTLIISDATEDKGLPVQLSSFVANLQDDAVVLEWQTESELENVGFIIKRSQEKNGEYQLLSSYQFNEDLQGHFNSSVAHHYSYTDETVLMGITYWYKLIDVDVNGLQTEHDPLSVKTDFMVIPKQFQLYAAFPNPFNPSTTLRFDIPDQGKRQTQVILQIFNSLGQKVKTVFRGKLKPGSYDYQWQGDFDNGQTVATGIYFAVLRASDYQQVQKLILVK